MKREGVLHLAGKQNREELNGDGSIAQSLHGESRIGEKSRRRETHKIDRQ